MADDENGSTHAASGIGPGADAKSHEPKAIETPVTEPISKVHEPSAAPAAGATEWTASDARGPLNEAKLHADAPHEVLPSGDIAHDTSTVSPAATETSTKAPHEPEAAPAVVARRKGNALPIAAGVILGAIIGAGSAYYVYSTMPDPAADKIAALSRRIDALDKKPDVQQAVAPLEAAIADLKTKVAAADAAARGASAQAAKIASNPPADTSALTAKLAALETVVGGLKQTQTPPTTDLKPLQDKLAGTDAKVGDLAAKNGDLTTKVGDLAAKIPTLTADLKAAQDRLTPLDATAAALQKQAAGTRTDVQALQAGQKSLEGKITSAPALAVVSDSLVWQINRGLPFTPQVNALESLGVDPVKIALLRQWSDQGVPTAKALEDKFDPLVDGMLAAPTKSPAGAGTASPPSFLDRMKEGLGSMVAVHRVDDTSGDDLASRIARIKAQLSHDDVIAAVATWNALPAETKAKPEAVAWGALAKTHADALATANAVESSAIAALGPKKS